MEKALQTMTKKQKIFRWFMIAFDLAIMLTGVAMAIYCKVQGDPDNRFLASLGMFFFGLVPFAYELISRGKIPNSVFLIFNIYLAVAGLWGAAFNGYNTFDWLDTVVHIIMGYAVSMLGLFILCRTKQNKTMHYVTLALFCVCFSLFVECIWEVCEWFVDNFFGQTAQGFPVEGYGAPLVTDTMIDIVCNLGGSLIFLIHYIVGKVTKSKFLFVESIEKEFSNKYILFEKSKKTISSPENTEQINDEENNLNKNEENKNNLSKNDEKNKINNKKIKK